MSRREVKSVSMMRRADRKGAPPSISFGSGSVEMGMRPSRIGLFAVQI